MKGKLKQTKGITLIALIITIIVLLILAVVSIRLVVNNGILGKAEYATQKYTEEEAAEQEKLLKAEYEMAKYEGKATGTYEEYVLDKMYGLKIGDYVNYDPTKDANGNTITGDKATYTSYSEEEAKEHPERNEGRTSGYTSNQVFNLSSYTGGWRVLGIENGKIQLISEEFIGPDEGGYTNTTYDRRYYYLKGQKGYIYGRDELDAISSIYGQGKGAESARSVTVEDVNKITGYNPEKTGDGKPYGSGHTGEYGNEVTYSWTSNNKVAYKGKYETEPKESGKTKFTYYDSATRTFKTLGEDENVTLRSNYYYYNVTTLDIGVGTPIQGVNEDKTFNTAYEMLFGNYKLTESNGLYNRNFTGAGAPQEYWLASSCVELDTGYAKFSLRFVGVSGSVSGLYGGLCDTVGGSSGSNYGVRPVVSLKSDIQLTGSSESGWTIQ